MKLQAFTVVLATVLTGRNANPQVKSSNIDNRVATLIRRMMKGSTEQKAFADLEALGCPAGPAIIRQMDDRRKLPEQRISLRNKSPQAFEGMRHYGPEEVVDALAAILNQVTGQNFGFIYNGAADAERSATVRGWRDSCRKPHLPSSVVADEVSRHAVQSSELVASNSATHAVTKGQPFLLCFCYLSDNATA